jgi:capsular polysaccharide export protein
MIREPLPVVPQGNTVWRERVPLPERLFLPLSGLAMHGKSAGHLAQLLHPSRFVSDPRKAQAVLAWGRKPSAERAQRVAAMHRLPLWRMEDAFLRSIRPGPAEQPLGVVFDDLGIYYDAACGSRLEWLINRPLDDSAEARAVNLIRLWREHGVSKYNHAREYGEDLPEDYVLVIDQTRGDLSTRHGAADESVFRRMLEAALEENPGDSLLLKVHPEVVAGRKKGHFDFRSLSRDRRIRLVIEDAHLVRLVKGAKKIYTVTSQAGFEGLLWGKIVRTFGMPFYAGWGLTEDDLARPARRTRCSLQQLAHAALVDYARYADPESGRRCGVEEIVEYLGTQRRLLGRYPAHLAAPGFPLAKRAAVRRFFCYSRVTFGRNPARAKGTDALLVWGRQTGRRDLREIPTIHLEDGFIRSIGLGSAFAPAASWVADRAGIYFDPTRPSDLENILQNNTFAPEVLARDSSPPKDSLWMVCVTLYLRICMGLNWWMWL